MLLSLLPLLRGCTLDPALALAPALAFASAAALAPTPALGVAPAFAPALALTPALAFAFAFAAIRVCGASKPSQVQNRSQRAGMISGGFAPMCLSLLGGGV